MRPLVRSLCVVYRPLLPWFGSQAFNLECVAQGAVLEAVLAAGITCSGAKLSSRRRRCALPASALFWLAAGSHPSVAFPVLAGWLYTRLSHSLFWLAELLTPGSSHPPVAPHPPGNAPTMMSWEDMQRVMPHFFNLSIAVHNDPAASKEWGWVQVGPAGRHMSCCECKGLGAGVPSSCALSTLGGQELLVALPTGCWSCT